MTLLFTGCTKETATTITVNAGSTIFVQLPADTVILTGTVTSNQSGNLSYLWVSLSGPAVPLIINGNSISPKIDNLVAGTYVFQFQATTSNGYTAIDTISVIVLPLRIKTITIQPGAFSGQDAEVTYAAGLYNGNDLSGTSKLLRIQDWTYFAQGAGEGKTRSFIKFTALDTLPASTTILNAKLSLTALSFIPYTGFFPFSYYPGSPYNTYGDNRLWLQRCTQNWDQKTITFNTQPAVTAVNQTEVPASTSEFNYNVTDLDVTQLIKDMKATPGTNFGFCLRLQNESYYRSMAFDASETKADSSSAPKLTITYQY